MHVLVTGATGFAGGHLARALAAEGHRVRALVRPGKHDRRLVDAGIELVEGQLTHAPDVRRAAEESIREALAPFARGDAVPLPASIWIVTARVR